MLELLWFFFFTVFQYFWFSSCFLALPFTQKTQLCF